MRRAVSRSAGAVALALAVLTACSSGSGQQQAPQTTQTSTGTSSTTGSTGTGASGPVTAPAAGVLLGAWVKPTSGQDPVDAVTGYERTLGRRLDLVHSYYKWDVPWPTATESQVAAAGSTPLVSWNGTDATSIVDGSQDAVIVARAQAAKAFGKPLLVRWFWEMDNRKKVVTAGSPQEYIAAWRHIHDVFAQQGVRNVSWSWCPTSLGFSTERAQAYYPGDDVVDWICADGYAVPSLTTAKVRSFADVFRDFYAWAAPHGKPLLIGEYGVSGPDALRARWLRQAGEQLQQQFPAVHAAVYFDSPEQGDFTLQGDPMSLAVLAGLAKQTYFNPRGVRPLG